MPNTFRSFAGVVLPLAAVALLGCQSPWQSGTPVAGDSGWFSWMTTSERSVGDPLERLAGGGVYSPGVAEADSGAERSRHELYGARASQLDLSRGGATNPEGAVANRNAAPQASAPQTLDQALPSNEDDAASRVVRALQNRGGAAAPAIAEQDVAQSPYEGAVAPAGYQAQEAPPVFAPSNVGAPRGHAGTAPPDAEANPFYDPFGERGRVATSAAPSTATKPASSGGSALRLLTTPAAPAESSSPTLTVPSGAPATPSGSLLKLLGENPLRKEEGA